MSTVQAAVNVCVNVCKKCKAVTVMQCSGSHSKGIHCPLLQIHIRSEFAGTGDTCPSSFAVHGPVGWEGWDCLNRRGGEGVDTLTSET